MAKSQAQPPASNRNTRPSHTYPLSAVFLLVATSAVLIGLAASIMPQLASEPTATGEAVTAVAAGASSGFVLGSILGLFHYRRPRGLLWGMLTGIFVGACVGPAALVDDFARITVIALTGAVSLMAFGICVGVVAKR